MNLVLRNMKLPSKLKPSIFHAYVVPKYVSKYSGTNQIEYLKSALDGDISNWNLLKNNLLGTQGILNEKNIDAVILKNLVRSKKFDAATSFVKYLKSSSTELNLGILNNILSLYYEIAKEKKLSQIERKFIQSTYKSLYKKHKTLDYYSSEKLLHALCAINECNNSLKVLDDICVSCIPSHSAYSTVIGTLFRNDREEDAMELIAKSVKNLRSLQDIAYEEWIKYILRKYKDNSIKLKHIENICLHVAKNCATISKVTAEYIKQTYVSLGWKAEFTKIIKDSGQCIMCNKTLQCLKLSDEEFNLLQKNIKEKLIVGSDLFIKTSPDELDKFLKLVNETAPYDIVLDALNIAYTVGKGNNRDKLEVLKTVVDYFVRKNKRILLIGRKHMLKWHRRSVEYLMSKTCSFFTDDISQDDPYFITAAIISGQHTHIVSKDLLRGHKFILKDATLRLLFQRWQWEHQYKVYLMNRRPIIQDPLQFTPCAQKHENAWHLPYEKDDYMTNVEKGLVKDGIQDCDSWLCLRPKLTV